MATLEEILEHEPTSHVSDPKKSKTKGSNSLQSISRTQEFKAG